MKPEHLEPRLDLVGEEYVLIQAWKKTSTYIRYHNWFSDTLGLDQAAVNLPAFMGEVRERLKDAKNWKNEPLRIVPAPKSQRWSVREDVWGPEKGPKTARLRPLAHISLADQVVATALMLCLADRVETLQGDPRRSVDDKDARRKVVSYGNRLYCEEINEILRHRWGSTKLYRAYSQDFATFLSRPEIAGRTTPIAKGRHLYIVHADLREFYDRVRPSLLSSAIARIRQGDDDPSFYSLAASLLDWGWHPSDERDVRIYEKQVELEDFTRVALPQGLVASGFFANIVLLAFDEVLSGAIGNEIESGILLVDACRYVDDLRILVGVPSTSKLSTGELGRAVTDWLEQALEENATGLSLSPKKTRVEPLGGGERPPIRQSAKMKRIQTAVSGGFDALGGEEILGAIQGLMRTQESHSIEDDSGWRLSPVPDVRDETVARFGAARYRTTFRSIRPLLQDDDAPGDLKIGIDDTLPGERLRARRTRGELDEDARAFALGLIQRWVDDPSNVRLLRIGLDLWPDVKLLQEVLSLLRPFTEKGGGRLAPRRVAWYCLAEVLRAGATETGIVPDLESLPLKVDLEAYLKELVREAARLVALPGTSIPWYLRQQALLFLAAYGPGQAPVTRTGRVPETRHYRELIRFLRGEGSELRLTSSTFATLAVLARRAFVDRDKAIGLTVPGLDQLRAVQIARKDPSFVLELIDTETQAFAADELPARIREDLCRDSDSAVRDQDTLARLVLNTHPIGPLRNELSLLRFATAFLNEWEQQESPPEVITPGQVMLNLGKDHAIARIEELRIVGSRVGPSGSLYEVAKWCEAGERWRIQLGFLMRFILSGEPDFTRPVRRTSWKASESCYRPAESHWYQRLYGLFSGQPAFGDDWLPITEWMEGFLLALLRWPGCRAPEGFDWVGRDMDRARTQIGKRIKELEGHRGSATGTLVLPLAAKPPTASKTKRPLRACVVQTVVPGYGDFRETDLELDRPSIRRKHRNHLSAALAAIERMLALRETHKGRDGRLDWLILPSWRSIQGTLIHIWSGSHGLTERSSWPG